ncbi:MAG: dihydroxyacetone kinase subunit DhaK [Methylobacteriaceae bacterium]|nr:dihydroxyacetone kinase subunit DhaK [Methylobacteriaceae bacterium]
MPSLGNRRPRIRALRSDARHGNARPIHRLAKIPLAILLVNGFGATPLGELYLLYNEAHRVVESAAVKPARSLVGSYVTSLDMAGASITLSLIEGDRARLWDAPVHTAALRRGM